VEGGQPNHRAQLVQFLRGLWPAGGPPHGKLEAYPTGLTLTGVETARTFASLTVVGGRPQPVFLGRWHKESACFHTARMPGEL
jgi:hypothetical protein